MFNSVDIILLNKIDVKPYIKFDMDFYMKGVREINDKVEVIPLSCVTGEGVQKWVDWLLKQMTS